MNPVPNLSEILSRGSNVVMAFLAIGDLDSNGAEGRYIIHGEAYNAYINTSIDIYRHTLDTDT